MRVGRFDAIKREHEAQRKKIIEAQLNPRLKVYCRCCNRAFEVEEETGMSYIERFSGQFHAKANCDVVKDDAI